MDDVNTDILTEVVGQMDGVFLQWNAEQLDRQRKSKQPKAGADSAKGGRSADTGGRR